MRSVQNRLVGPVSVNCHTAQNCSSLKNFEKPNATLRSVIATAAFGMGIQVEDIDLVLHWAPSKNILAYWQEVGRCGRDGRQAETYLYIHMLCTHRV